MLWYSKENVAEYILSRQTALVMLNDSLVLIPRPILGQVNAYHRRSRVVP